MYRCPKCKGDSVQANVWVDANLYPDALEITNPLPDIDDPERFWCLDCSNHVSPIIEEDEN
jgi:hypothetical protein